LVVLLGAALSHARHRRAAAALIVLSVLHGAIIHGVWRYERRYAEGAREALEWIRRERPSRVIADDKTVEALDFFEGHRPARQYLPFPAAGDWGRSVVILDNFWIRPGRWTSRPAPPEVWAPPSAWRKVYSSERITIYRT